MIPLPKGSLSHGVIDRMDEVMQDHNRAEIFAAAMREITAVIKKGNWALAELLYWFDYHKLWAEATYMDTNGNTKKFDSFREFIKFSGALDIGPAWAYILKGVYETFTLELKIDPEKPDLFEKLLSVGSFEKLYLIRKVVTPENVGHWLDVAAVMERDELDRTVNKSLLEEANTLRLPPRTRVIPKKWRASRLPLGELASKTVLELIEAEDIPENAYLDVYVEIVDYEQEGEDEEDA